MLYFAYEEIVEKGILMNKTPIAAAMLVAICTASVLFAYAEPTPRKVPAKDDGIHYCRTNLEEEEQLIYDALLECTLSKDPTQRSTAISISMDPAEDAFRTSFRRCYNALVFDHPELFWLSVGDSTFQYSYRRNLFHDETFQVSFQMTEAFPDKDAQMKELDSAAEELLSRIDPKLSPPQKALAIHDELIELVSYDKETASNMNKDLAHTAYGALVANSSGEANTAVCDGYSYAYEYLLQKAGIRSTVIAGRAGETEETAGSHSWNLVDLSGQWYEVDPTWNDISAEEALDSSQEYSAIAEEAMNNEWYTDRLTHYLFNVTTEQISHFEPGKYYRYTNDQGWVTFLGDSVHIRHTEADSEETGDYMTPLAPVAEGTEYTYEALTE